MERTGVSDLSYPDRRIRALGEAAGFHVLNLGEGFVAVADQQQVYLHGFENTALGWGHWNERGHELAAKLIAQWLAAVPPIALARAESGTLRSAQ
jgi:hypothetical protein